jgi:quercetin dioxygenase-like cupin family protein
MALHHARPGEIVDLGPIGSGLTSARTAAIIKADHFEAIRLIVHAGAEIPQHKVSGEITLHCLEGHVELGIAPTPIALKANEWVYLEGGVPHSVKAIKDSSLLLTIFLEHPSQTSKSPVLSNQ